MLTTVTYLEAPTDSATSVSLKIQVPASDTRTPCHFIALLDISDSMNQDDKLQHAKHCMTLLLKFMTPLDEISLVTFGENSRILLNRVKTVTTELPRIRRAIDGIKTDLYTNLSAGLGSVREVLEGARDSPLKTGLLLLTDGHANTGAFSSPELTAIVKRLVELFPTLSYSFLAYGTDHNAELLKALSDETRGTYSIVESLESAALATGNALGGIISCVAQNVVVEVPKGTTVEGPYKLLNDRVILGDLYADSKVFLLLKKMPGPCFLAGASLPLLEPFRTEIPEECAATFERNAEVELTRLRYTCSDLFRDIRRTVLTGDARRRILEDIAAFKEKLADSFLAGNPITDMLKDEVESMEAAVGEIDDNGGTTPRVLFSHLVQHEAYSSSGGGVTNTIRRRRAARVNWEDENDENDEPRTYSASQHAVQSPMVPGVQRRTAAAMQTLSQEQ